MEKLEIFLINLFMWGELFSIQGVLDTTIIQCEGFVFEFRQQDIKLKQSEYINKTILTTIVTVRDITEEQIPQILEIIDNICWLLSFAQQSPVARHGYKVNASQESFDSCLGIIVNPLKSIINDQGKAIRNFIEQTYPTFKKLKLSRQLTVVIGYICESNRDSLASEAKLILHYVLIENLKHTFAIHNGFIKKEKERDYIHPSFPDLENEPQHLEEYETINHKTRKRYRHKKYGKCGTAEMTKRMFQEIGLSKEDSQIKATLDKRNKMIHEGILLPLGDPNYSKQAVEDLQNVSDLLRLYLLNILNYKGAYYLSGDRIGCSGLIT